MMTFRKKLFLTLLIIPLLLALPLLIWPVAEGDQYNILELLSLIIGLPIIVLNYLEWYAPEVANDIFGQEKETKQAVIKANSISSFWTNFMGKGLPGSGAGGRNNWVFYALLICVLILGIALGAGTLYYSSKSSLQSSSRLEITEFQFETSAPEVSLTASPYAAPTMSAISTIVANAINITLTPTITSAPTATWLITRTSIVKSPTPTHTLTPATSLCGAPSLVQLTSLQAGVQRKEISNELRTGYIVKSDTIDNLWFVAAKIHGTEIDGGITLPGVWAFMGSANPPTDIFSVNIIAQQYSDFPFGQKANPPLNMLNDGAQDAYNCALTGN